MDAVLEALAPVADAIAGRGILFDKTPGAARGTT